MKIAKLALFIITAMAISFPLLAEDEYKVSGMVVRNDVGVGEVVIDFSPHAGEGRCARVKTDHDGKFSLFLSKGKYAVSSDFIFEGSDPLIIIGPDGNMLPYMFNVLEKNVVSIKFRLFTYVEIVEANREIFKKKIDHATITTRWGEIPIFSMEECRAFAEKKLAVDREDRLIDSELMNEAVLGDPIIFYDLQGNAAYYQFPEIIRGVAVSFIGVFAIGRSPVRGSYSAQIAETDRELRDLIVKKESHGVTSDIFIPRVIERAAEIKKCSVGDIEFVKLLCIDPTEIEPFYALLRMKSSGDLYAIHLHYYITGTLEVWDEFYKENAEWNEILNACVYIKQRKSDMGLPLKGN